jgi:peroxiredoxin
LQSYLPELQRRDIAVVSISVDEAAATKHLTEQLGLGFPLLSDPSGDTIKAFGVFDWQTEIAWPSIFVVGKDGTIVHRWLADTYRERISTADVMKQLEARR